MNLSLHIKYIDKICRKTIEDIDKSNKNCFGITYCDLNINKDYSGEYYLYVRYHKWGSKTFRNEYGHYVGTFDSYYIKLNISYLTQEYIVKRIHQYFDEHEYEN